jgi:guanine deaminase
VTHYPDGLILPGLIDTHIHYAQTQVIGSYGAQLLDWLNRYTFPAERRFADPAHGASDRPVLPGRAVPERHDHGRGLPHRARHSVDAICGAAEALRMRLLTGKIMMDDGPEGLRDTVGKRLPGLQGADRALARPRADRLRGHPALRRDLEPGATRGRGRTPRRASRLLAADPSLGEPGRDPTVAERFPEARDYLDVYDRAGSWAPARSSATAST